MVGGTGHEHIEGYAWENTADGKSGKSTKPVMVDWINRNGPAKVRDLGSNVDVLVVNANPPYLRTQANSRPTDNLLRLPRY